MKYVHFSLRNFIGPACIVLFALTLFTGCSEEDAPVESNGVNAMNVAIYPYVPRPEQFKNELREKWADLHPDIELNFIEWDCYSQNPPDSLDVFVFDGIFLSNFVQNGYLLPLQQSDIDNFGDFLPYAINGCKDTNDATAYYYGMPQIGCAYMLYYRKGDSELANANSLSEVYTSIGTATYSSVVPPFHKGLLMDMSGGTTNACLYEEASIDNGVPYSWNPPMPSYTDLDADVVSNLRSCTSMGGTQQVKYYSDTAYARGYWFMNGSGKGMVGFTETMSVMTDSLSKMYFKLMPLSNTNEENLFYIDVVGINANISDNKKSLALELANLMASSDYMIDAFGPSTSDSNPQYLMPVRQSVFNTLKSEWPMYAVMDSIVNSCSPNVFKLGSDSRTWLSDNKSQIRDTITTLP